MEFFRNKEKEIADYAMRRNWELSRMGAVVRNVAVAVYEMRSA
jgi:hypothetical protein